MTFAQLVSLILGFANTLVPILIGLALVAFFVGLVRYIYYTGSGGTADGRELIQWGIIALFLLVCIWGIVAFIRTTFLGS